MTWRQLLHSHFRHRFITHTRSHTHCLTHMHAHTHSLTHIRVHTHTHAHTLTPHTHTLSLSHTHTHTRSLTKLRYSFAAVHETRKARLYDSVSVKVNLSVFSRSNIITKSSAELGLVWTGTSHRAVNHPTRPPLSSSLRNHRRAISTCSAAPGSPRTRPGGCSTSRR